MNGIARESLRVLWALGGGTLRVEHRLHSLRYDERVGFWIFAADGKQSVVAPAPLTPCKALT